MIVMQNMWQVREREAEWEEGGRVRETEEDDGGGGEERREEEKTVLVIQDFFVCFFPLRFKVLWELHINQDHLIYN